MMHFIRRIGLDPQQRQSLEVNITATMTAILLLTLLAIVGFIIIRGSSFFWPTEVYTLRYLDPESGVSSQAFAQIRETSVRAPRLKTINETRLRFVDVEQEQTWSISRVMVD